MVETLGLGASLLGLALASSAGADAVVWKRVADAHASSLELPISILKPKTDPLGLKFEADDGATIYVSTVTEPRADFPGHNPKEDMDLKRSDCTVWPPAYHVVKKQLAAYSCVKGERIEYYIARYTPYGSMALTVEYPKDHAGFWSKLVERMAGSMRQVKRREVWP